MVTFGGYIGLTSFFPTLFLDQYGIAKEDIGKYSAGIIVMASVLRVMGGWLADRIGGLRILFVLYGIVIAATAASALLPANPWMMVAILVVCFSAMGAGNGAVFQLVPLRFKTTTAVAGSLIGEIGALAGGFLPITLGYNLKHTGSFATGFLSGTVLAIAALVVLPLVFREWTGRWIGAGGRAIAAPSLVVPTDEAVSVPPVARPAEATI